MCHDLRRGVALLLVLAALVLVMSAAAALARSASTSKLQTEFNARGRLADDLLLASEAPILEWLAKESMKTVLPPESTSPQVDVLREAIDLETAEHEVIQLTITAWDQLGMVPMRVARSGSPLRLALPDTALRVLDQLELPAPDTKLQLGLDLVSATLEGQNRQRVFPKRGGAIDSAPGLGALLATHNPGNININTAPMPIVEAALRAAGMGGFEAITTARAEGRTAPAPPMPPNQSEAITALALVGTSGIWSFCTDITIGHSARQTGGQVEGLTKSWWSIYENRNSKWELVQRLAITE